MKFGYARVSTEEQRLDLQMDALEKAGCERIFSEHASGAKTDRPELAEMMKYLREGDTVVVYKLDRLGRSMKHLIELIEQFDALGVNFVSISDAIDTSTPTGRLFFHVMASLAEFERDLIRERTKAGLEAARARGKNGGRPATDQKKVDLALRMYESKEYTIKEICEASGISVGTLYKYIEKAQKEASAERGD